MDRERVLDILNSEMKAARRRFHLAEDLLDFAMRPAGLSYAEADRQQQVKLAGRTYTIAANNFRAALYRMSRLVTEGTVPDELMAKPARRENVRSIDYRKSA